MMAGISRSGRVIARELRTENEEKAATLDQGKQARRHPKQGAANQIPPYCYRLPGMSAEEGAAAAVKALRITHACDALAILWKLQRERLEQQSDNVEGADTNPLPKTQHNPNAQAQRIKL